MFDIIGDIHGHAGQLKKLLNLMGYERKDDIYQHPKNKAIFIGDLINKGKNTRKVIKIVRSMVENGHAYAIPGNHEFNFLSCFTDDENGKSVRKRSKSMKRQYAPTLRSYEDYPGRLQQDISWLKSLPLFLEFENLRCVHAFWHEASIRYLIKKYGNEPCLNDLLIKASNNKNNREHAAVNLILKGIELKLPGKHFYEDPYGKIRYSFKARWWNLRDSDTYYDLAIKPREGIINSVVQQAASNHKYSYHESEKPLFIGHFNLPSEPYLIANNICCVDFQFRKKSVIVAYRWNGELQLTRQNFISSS